MESYNKKIEKKNCSEMSNAEIKLYMEILTNGYEVEKKKLQEICDYMKSLEDFYQDAERELSIRKNILF